MYLTVTAIGYLVYRTLKTKEKKLDPTTQIVYDILKENGFVGAQIGLIKYRKSYIDISIALPPNKTNEQLAKLLPKIKDDLAAIDVTVRKIKGKWTTITLGINNLDNVIFKEEMLQMNSLKILLPTAYGEMILDFDDGASCHLLNGGATRMGKTHFLVYMLTVLYTQTNGDMNMYISSAKLQDFNMFFDLPNVNTAESEDETINHLLAVQREYNRRKGLFKTIPELSRLKDARDVREKAPHLYYEFKPIFFCIDELARFAENDVLMDLIIELAETAGYLGVHLIVASQRPDAQTVMKPRIKANMLARLAFTTSDAANSKIILDREGAELLGGKQGRGIFQNGLSSIIQIPYMKDEVSLALLSSFYKEKETDDVNDEDEKRHNDPPLPKALQSAIEKSVSVSSL